MCLPGSYVSGKQVYQIKEGEGGGGWEKKEEEMCRGMQGIRYASGVLAALSTEVGGVAEVGGQRYVFYLNPNAVIGESS